MLTLPTSPPASAALLTAADFMALPGEHKHDLIDPVVETAQFFRLDAERVYADVTPARGEPFESAALPGFRLDPADVLADPLPSEYRLLTRMLA